MCAFRTSISIPSLVKTIACQTSIAEMINCTLYDTSNPWMRYIHRLTFQNTSEDYVVVLSINLKNILLVSTFQFPLKKPLTNGLYMPRLSTSEGACNADWINILQLQTRAIITAMLLKRATCWVEYTIHLQQTKKNLRIEPSECSFLPNEQE